EKCHHGPNRVRRDSASGGARHAAIPWRAQGVLPAAASGISDSRPSQAGGNCDARTTLQKEPARKRGQRMKFNPDTLASVHEQMALIKAQSIGVFFTNYFRQEMVGPQILTAATDRSLLLANDEHDFFRLFFLTTDLADFEQLLRDAHLPGSAVAGYLTRAADENI